MCNTSLMELSSSELDKIFKGFREAVSFLGMDEAAPLSSLDGFLYDFIKLNEKVAFCNIYERAVGNPCFR